MDAKDHETLQWLLLLGAMLGSAAFLKESGAKLSLEDVPQPYKPLWQAMQSGQAEAVRGVLVGWGVEANGEKTLAALLRAVQQRALAEYCRNTVTRAGLAKGVDPDQLLVILETMATRIRAKQDGLENGK